MRRKRQTGNDLAVNLFPFLAVLICTMGVLIVMLVMAVKSSQVRAAEVQDEHRQGIAGQREALLDQLDLEQFRVDEIQAMRPGLQQRLSEQRDRRSHLEDETRRLRNEVKELLEQWEQTQADSEFVSVSSDDQLDEIRSLELLVDQREQQLDEMRQQVAGRPMLYSIVPTKSASGTSRRPIYVECRPDGLFLRPSGIHIALDQFTIPVVAGNPLDAALLASREHWNRYDAAGTQGNPYPLLVVRPGGAPAYAVARRAMKSWDEEFGYELIESTRQIDWGNAEPALTNSLIQAIEDAAIRQQRLVATRQVQWIGEEHLGISGQSGRGTSHLGSRGGNANNSFASQGTASAEYGGDQHATGNGADQTDAGGQGNQLAVGQQFASAARDGDRNLTTGSSRDLDSPLSEFGGSGASSMASGSDELNGRPGTGQSMTQRSGSETAQRDSQYAAHQSDSSEEGNSGSPASGNSPGRAQAAGNAQSRSGNAGGMNAGNPPSQVASAMAQSMAHVTPLSETRGQDWALPTRTQGATAYRRPIRIDCIGSEFVLYNTDPARRPVRVPAAATLDESVDALIHQIWNQIEDWGMAEAGGYWKPVLRLSANEQGARRAAELTRKLDGSGIEIERQLR